MKKTAVLIYNGFCNFEKSVALEIPAMAGKQITVFSKELNPTISEDCIMIGWDDNLKNPVQEGCIISGNIVTSVSYHFVKRGLAFGRMLGIDIPPETFGLGA